MNTPLVYIIECDGFYKIGFTRNSIEDRVRSFQHGNPHKISIHSTFMTFDAYRLERFLHEKFVQYRVRGEWFKLTDEAISKIPLLVYEFTQSL